MDTDHQDSLQSLGIFGIIKESMKILFKWWKIFSLITLTMILPFALIFLAHFEISGIFLSKISDHEESLKLTQVGGPQHKKLSETISLEQIELSFFEIANIVLYMILFLLSTPAVVYTVACEYTGKDVTFKKVMTAVRRARHRVAVTLFWGFFITLVYNMTLNLFIIIMELPAPSAVRIGACVVIGIIYVMGLIYVNLVWQLATVMTVLEDSYGLRAFAKSEKLIQGKPGTSLALSLLSSVCSVGIEAFFVIFVVSNGEPRLGFRVLISAVCLMVLATVFLIELVVQTVLYFVCKSSCHEYDKDLLSNHLDGFLGDFHLPVRSKNVQLVQLHGQRNNQTEV